MKENKYDQMYMDFATRASQESKCPRKQVGCCILLETGVISIGLNGHAPGGPNEWEWKENGDPEVIHAEWNSLGKLLEEGISCKNATVYVTLSPCLECSKLLVRAKVKRVVYNEDYRKRDGLDYLIKYGVQVEKFGVAVFNDVVTTPMITVVEFCESERHMGRKYWYGHYKNEEDAKRVVAECLSKITFNFPAPDYYIIAKIIDTVPADSPLLKTKYRGED